ncbi:MAG: hypothetical protein K8R21_13455 [Leptospira sp.]|nr:hypothetical protein [Leptospira sp.]
MDKCHCSGISFEKIVDSAKRRNCSYKQVVTELGVADTCTACKIDLEQYCDSRLDLVKIAS